MTHAVLVSTCLVALLLGAGGGGGTVTVGDAYLTSALARVAGRGAAFLDQTPAGWRISAAGCVPTAPGKPYDCELES